MTEQRSIHPSEDPVCVLRVDVSDARGQGLAIDHGEVEYSFCSRGCLAGFQDDPAWFLDRAYTPTRM